MSCRFTESVVEDATLAWLESIGYTIKHGPAIAPGEWCAVRMDYGQVVFEGRLRDTLPPKLIFGEQRVKDTKRVMKAVV